MALKEFTPGAAWICAHCGGVTPVKNGKVCRHCGENPSPEQAEEEKSAHTKEVVSDEELDRLTRLLFPAAFAPVPNTAHCIRCGRRMNFPASVQRPGVDVICMDCL